jgi:hypothetical protein
MVGRVCNTESTAQPKRLRLDCDGEGSVDSGVAVTLLVFKLGSMLRDVQTRASRALRDF